MLKGSKLTATGLSSSKKFTNSNAPNITTQSSARFTANTQNVKDDDYITNLQKQVYYLELEMKLMKDRELETKNKVGGYEILFRDGVPLNEHFLALKTKYTNEKEKFEKVIQDLAIETSNIEDENKSLTAQIEDTNKNYYEILDRISKANEFYQSKISELSSKLFNENNLKEMLDVDKEITAKALYRFNSESVQYNRLLDKKKLFKESKDEKNENTKIKHLERFKEVDKATERSILELEVLERKLANTSKKKIIENENEVMLSNISKLERDLHTAKAKVVELENIQVINRKHLLEEELLRDTHIKESKRLTQELDGINQQSAENEKQKVKENEKKQWLIIKNQIANSELKMGILLKNFKEEETFAKNLLEEKNVLSQKLLVLMETIENQKSKEATTKLEIVDVKNEINALELTIEDSIGQLEALIAENERLRITSEKYEVDIKSINIKIEEIQQKIELNAMLKDIDLGELKMLSQNNAIVNSSINSLISKWDKVHTKLQEIESKEKKK